MKFNSLKTKLAVIVGAGFIFAIGVVVFYSAYTAHRNAVESATEIALAEAKDRAGEIKAEIEIALNESRAIASALSAVKNSDEPLEISRAGVMAMLRNLTESNSSYLGTYTLWEPDAFDGIDDQFRNAPGHDHTGRFIPFWSREGLEPLADYEVEGDGDYYLVPRRTMREAVIDPYYYDVAGTDVLLMSLVTPVLNRGVFYGITGIDYEIDFIQQMANAARLNFFDGQSEISIVSNNGTFAANTADPRLIGRSVAEYRAGLLEGHLRSVLRGSELTESTGSELYVSVPLEIGNTRTPWMVNISVPMNLIRAGAVRQMWNQILIGLMLSVISVIVTYLFLDRSLSPLGTLAGSARKIAGGDLTEKISLDRNDEIGLVASAFNEMIDKLEEIVGTILQSAANIVSASTQMSDASQQISQGASEQASSTEEVSSSMEQMVSNIMQNTDNARQTEKISISAAERIKEVASSANNSIVAIRQIADKITIVNDIAFQTNILALNAAVEAARAGEYGRGFAVVAGEVKKLAERSKAAADEIMELSQQTVKTTEQSGKLLNDIAPDITNTADLVKEIAMASTEQNSGAEQINNAIQQLSQITQQNAASSEEMATGAEELASQAGQLQEIVSYFRTMQDNSIRHEKGLTSFTGVMENGGNGFKLESVRDY